MLPDPTRSLSIADDKKCRRHSPFHISSRLDVRSSGPCSEVDHRPHAGESRLEVRLDVSPARRSRWTQMKQPLPRSVP
jgi:hypothetical protein